MSANWSIAYFEKSISDDAFFKAVQEAFRQFLEGKLYGLKWDDNQELVPFQLDDSTTEQFSGDVKRARLIQDALITELLGHGILHYPQRNNLHVIVDSIIRLDVYSSGRIRREELKRQLEAKPDPMSEVLFHMMDFLRYLTQILECQSAHVMFDHNPAGNATGVHLYDSGTFVDDYYYENLEGVGSEMVERIQSPQQVETFLNGRFAFLNQLPVIKRDSIDGNDDVYYFDGEDLSSNRLSEHFGVNQTDLYVPFWEENTLPIGAIYALKGPLPDYFLNRYDR
ncbi:MAG: hypothetical protein RLP44_19610 [Aggregatilineales bacterium]